MPAQHRGAISGLATTTKGMGLLIGPLVAGVLIDVMKPYLSTTDGYGMLWPVCAVPVLAAIPLVASLIPHERASGLNLGTAGGVVWHTVALERAAQALHGNDHC